MWAAQGLTGRERPVSLPGQRFRLSVGSGCSHGPKPPGPPSHDDLHVSRTPWSLELRAGVSSPWESELRCGTPAKIVGVTPTCSQLRALRRCSFPSPPQSSGPSSLEGPLPGCACLLWGPGIAPPCGACAGSPGLPAGPLDPLGRLPAAPVPAAPTGAWHLPPLSAAPLGLGTECRSHIWAAGAVCVHAAPEPGLPGRVGARLDGTETGINVRPGPTCGKLRCGHARGAGLRCGHAQGGRASQAHSGLRRRVTGSSWEPGV